MIILRVRSRDLETFHDFDFMWQLTDFAKVITQIDPEAEFCIFT
jgi:hypothetical protein